MTYISMYDKTHNRILFIIVKIKTQMHLVDTFHDILPIIQRDLRAILIALRPKGVGRFKGSPRSHENLLLGYIKEVSMVISFCLG